MMRDPIKSVLSLAFAFGLAAFAQTASAAPTAKAVWDANTNTFTFYYDENTYEGDGITQYALTTENKWNTEPAWKGLDWRSSVTKVVFTASFANFQQVCMNYWFDGFSKLTTIEGMENLDTSKANYCNYMFSECSSLTSIDLSHFNTATMIFRGFFNKCSNIEVLDLTSFTKFSDLRDIFSGMSKLRTIYVADTLECNADSTTANTFKGCKALVGGGNPPTTFANANITHGGYARIDNPPDAPGYFTLGQKPVPPEVKSVMTTEVTWESATVTVDGSALNGGVIVVGLVAGDKTAKSVELTEFGSVVFTGLTPATEYTVKVTATSSYGTTVDEATSFTTQPLPVPTISSVTVDTVLHDTVMLTVSGESIADVEVTVELVKGDEVRATKTEDVFGKFVIEGLTPETTYTVKVTATNQYGHSVDETMNFTTLEQPADEWKVVWDETGKAGTISWGAWEFGVTVKDGAVTVGKYTKTPSSPMPLDFSLPIVDGNGGTYVIVKLDTQFGKLASSGDARAEPFPEAKFVSLLTLPPTVTEISNYAFTHCVNLIGTIPADNALKTIGVAAFVDTQLSGDVVLPEIEKILNSAFWGTKITSIRTGDKLNTFDSNYDRGVLQKCVCLTNVSFDATKPISLLRNFTFCGCSALEELDLSMVLNFDDPTKEGNSLFGGCTSLKKLVFGAVTNLPPQVLYTPALEKVVFEGVPPVGFVLPGGDHTTRYLSPVSAYKTIDGVSTPIHDTIFDKKLITTYVHHRLCGVTNEAGKCWNDYAANGVIGPARKNPAKNTTWAAEYVYEGVNLANRPLLTMEPNGFLLLVR